MNVVCPTGEKVRLSKLLEGVVNLPENMDVDLEGIESDSRYVSKGDIFLAYQGASNDGRAFIDDAIDKGVYAILVEKDEHYSDIEIKSGVPVIPLESLSSQLGAVAAKFYGQPARELWCVGITGTNGKTSCCQYVAQLYAALGKKCGISGTLGWGMYGDELQGFSVDKHLKPGTTPEAIVLQKILKKLKDQHAESVVIEISSHGLSQDRIKLDDINVALFTNLSRDHLDYYPSMKAYGEAKRKLFSQDNLDVAIVNLDDEYGESIIGNLKTDITSYTYSVKNSLADVYGSDFDFYSSGVRMSVTTPWGKGRVNSMLLGSFNVSNTLAALTVLLASESKKPDFNFDVALQAASELKPVSGRMEVVADGKIKVVVDYAHTPEALKTALIALREHGLGAICCVFGCGGERDRGKRPIMAKVAEQYADKIIVTDDNPRKEDSEEIINQILSGFTSKNQIIVESDRAMAISYAIDQAKLGDVILLAGKGHENYQDVGGNRVAFSDVKQARSCLKARLNW